MDMTTWIVVIVLVVTAIGGAVYFYRSRKKKMDQLFEQILETSKQVPNQKKHSFLLFMFRETAKAAKAKNSSLPNRANDQKYLEIQLIQMTSILKDRSKVTDKQMKQALQMYDSYIQWEKIKFPKSIIRTQK